MRKISTHSFIVNSLAFFASWFIYTHCAAADVNNLSSPSEQAVSAELANSLVTEPAQLAEIAEIATNQNTTSENTATQTNATSSKTVSAKNPSAILASLAFNGKSAGGIRSYAEAAELFCRDARDSNDANAQYALGWMYENGKGVTKDDNIAVKFYSMAAKQFHEAARASVSASAGNPNIAKLPECMTKQVSKPVLKDANLADSDSEATAKPFYVKGSVYKLVSKIAPRYNIDTDLAMAFIAVESGYNPNATSAKNAQGLMQLIPETAARFKVKNSYDPEQNIKGGLAYLQWLLTYFEGNIELVAAAYNAGENAVDRYKGVPPYPETRKYVKKIAALYKKPHHPFAENAGASKKSSFIKVSG